jgi:hypothetical protein
MAMIGGQTAAAFCSRCGKPLKAGALFCGSCGAPVLQPAPEVPPPPPPPPTAPVGPARRKRNRHWGLVLTAETIFCGGLTVVFVSLGAPPILEVVFGLGAVVFGIALVWLLVARSRRGEGLRSGH